MTPKLKRNIKRVIPFGLIWLIFGIIFLIIEYAATKDFGYTINGVIKLDYKIVLFALPVVTIVGLILGIIELLFINQLFLKKSFLTKVIGKSIIYSLFLFIIICIAYPVAASIELKTNIFDEQILNKFSEFINSISFISTSFQMAVSLVFTLFYNEISEKVGPNSFSNFITGKYHKPKIENRIFMFLDMKSSTAIAEKIGHHQYFKLLNEYYNVISEAVITYSGEVYQYVGDEMVVSWKVSKNINNNCIYCFFKMKHDLENRKSKFIDKYKVHPTFKAGIHFGEVTTGEIGRIKKDVVFTGDTLNTTARIQGLCNELSVDLLISSQLLNILNLDHPYSIKFKGNNELKGRKEVVDLYTIEEQVKSDNTLD
ncbi:adenylate/guanylate cyclase domain-containing protein [Winogradskyella sp. 4-2091]|uniref:adenylate/guanylate cyclase domain-containing protein n=1 Tax=Winogradskyella sp. 4-2091 TaxID=3381659 RepID=UPI0038915312